MLDISLVFSLYSNKSIGRILGLENLLKNLKILSRNTQEKIERKTMLLPKKAFKIS